MNPKIEYTLIVVSSILLPLLCYFAFISITQNRTEESPLEVEYNPFGLKANIEKDPIKLLFVGDIMLDRTIRKDGEEYGYLNLFSCLKDTFSRHTLVIGNLEGTVTNFESVSRDADYQDPASFKFTFDDLGVEALRDTGLDIVSISNNHIKDFGEEGVIQTIKNLNKLGIDFFGNPLTKQERWIIKDINGTKIAFIPYNEFFGTKEETFADIETVKPNSDLQVVFTHWGDEYVPPREDVILLAHQFVDSGVDLVIGSHPHIIQEKEVYKNVPIYYSIGNFIFDQYFEEAVTKGLGVSVEILDKKIIAIQELNVLSERHKGSCFVE